jgi:hypothetical protein
MHRAFLKVPKGVPFRVYPRYRTRKNTKPDSTTDHFKNEFILKVAWYATEEHCFDSQFPKIRKVQCGTTLVLDWYTGEVESVLTTDLAGQKAARDTMVEALAANGLLDHPAEKRSSERSISAVDIDLRSGALMLNGAARLLHFSAPDRRLRS